MNVLTAVSSLMRRLANSKVLITTGTLFLTSAVVFYASPLAKCVTGTSLPVNAGHWMPPSA